MNYDNSAAAKMAFEVHVGFPTALLHLWDGLQLSEPNDWKVLTATEIVVLSGGECFDAHEVPTPLGKLVTKRVSSAKEAYVEVDRMAKFFSSNPDIRIEMEQVLMTQGGVEEEDWIAPVDFIPDQSDLEYAEIIPETPPFEAHLMIEGTGIAAHNHYAANIARLAESVGVPVHQAVCFDNARSEKRVILTIFYSGYEEMVESVTQLSQELGAAIKTLDSTLTLKIAAERIILCAKPINSLLPEQV